MSTHSKLPSGLIIDKALMRLRAANPNDPLIFHVVMGWGGRTISHDVSAVEYLRDNVVLAPPATLKRYGHMSLIQRGWPKPPKGREHYEEYRLGGMLGGLDAQAGDDRYTFFTLGTHTVGGDNTFAFRLSDVLAWCSGRVGFRPRDLGTDYRTADKHYVEGAEKIQGRKLFEVKARLAEKPLTKLLREVADCGTCFDRVDALAKYHLLARLSRVNTWAKVERHLPPYAHHEPETPDGALPYEWGRFWAFRDVARAWRRCFDGAERHSRSTVEIVVGCPLPVRLATFYSTERGGTWRANPWKK